MTATNRQGIHREGMPVLPSIGLACLSLILWLIGTDVILLMPWLCFVSALVTAQYILVEAKFPSLFTWFAVAYICLFLVYPVVAPLLGVEIPTSDEVFLDYCFLTVGGLHLFLVGYAMAASRDARRCWDRRFKVTWNHLFTAICVLLFLNVAAMLLLIADAGSFSRIVAQSRDEMKLSLTSLSMCGFYLFLIGVVLYPLLGAYIRYQPLSAVIWLPILAGLEIFLFLMFRVRTYPVMHATGLLMGWLFIAPRLDTTGGRLKRPLATRLTTVQMATVGAILIGLVLGMFVLRVFRGRFEKAGSISDLDIDVVASMRYAFEGGGELGYSRWVFMAMEAFPTHHDYLNGQSYYRLLFVPIPRSLWPGKPENSERIIAQVICPGALEIMSTPVGIIGDLYVNFGMLGIVGMFGFGLVFGRLDRGEGLIDGLFLAVSFASVFHLTRGAFTNPVAELVILFVTSKLVVWYLSQNGQELSTTRPKPIQPGERRQRQEHRLKVVLK